MKLYPINLINLERRQTVVVGGGSVATRKVSGLLAAGARVTVISPELSPELTNLVEQGQIAFVERAYREGDLAGAWLVIAATGEPQVNQQVWQEAERRGCLVNVVDDPAHCNFIVPAVLRRGEMMITISTGGASPALARRLRERLESVIGPEYGDLAALLAELRPHLQARFPDPGVRSQVAYRLVDSDLAEIIRADGLAAARTRALALLAEIETASSPG
jgi:precorrin-2 dehydrogenase/sirohydrochlorin ferrochelatase